MDFKDVLENLAFNIQHHCKILTENQIKDLLTQIIKSQDVQIYGLLNNTDSSLDGANLTIAYTPDQAVYLPYRGMYLLEQKISLLERKLELVTRQRDKA